MNVLTWAWNALTLPRLPLTACAFTANSVSFAEARLHHGHRTVERAGVFPLPPGLVNPSFTESNIVSIRETAEHVRGAAELVGLGRVKRWNVVLPAEVARAYIVSLDKDVGGKREIDDLLVWKIERLAALPIDEVRVSHQPLSKVQGHQRFLVVIGVEAVLREYERLVAEIGGQAGLLWPRTVSEAVWLNHPAALPDQILLSTSGEDMTLLILHGGEPALLRTQTVGDEDFCNTLHRLLLFYRDRAGEIIPGISLENTFASTLFEVLAIGDWTDSDLIAERVRDVFGQQPLMLSSESLGYAPLHPGTAPFSQIAAVAGLACLGLS